VVFPFPIDVEQVLEIIAALAAGRLAPATEAGAPEAYDTSEAVNLIGELLRVTPSTQCSKRFADAIAAESETHLEDVA
jgi:hypothetical protein